METATLKTPLTTQTIKEFVKEKGFTQIVPVVRVNKTGYPYLTFINKDNVAENIYFSKAASKAIEAGLPVTKEMINSYQVAETTNGQGEKRIKLVTNSERVELNSLLN